MWVYEEDMKKKKTNKARAEWHDLLSEGLTERVTHYPFTVYRELDLSRRKQRLDVAIMRLRDCDPSLLREEWEDMPDGLTDLVEHNLLTYKPINSTLYCGSLWFLISYFAAYAVMEQKGDLVENKDAPPEEKEEKKKATKNEPPIEKYLETMIEQKRVRLYAVCTHRPTWLAELKVTVRAERENGIYTLEGYGLPMRLIVTQEVEVAPRNALWLLLSGDEAKVRYAQECYKENLKEETFEGILKRVANLYQKEGMMIEAVNMEEVRKEMRREFVEENLDKVSKEKRQEFVAEHLYEVPEEKRLEGIRPQSVLKHMTPEERAQLKALLEKDENSDSV